MITEICGIDAGRQHVAQEHLAVAAERGHAFLDARAAGVEQADDGRAVLQRHVLDLGDLLGVRLRQRAAEHREVLGEHVDHAAVDGAPAGDDAVAGDLGLLHAEVGAAVLDVHVELLEGVVVHEQVDALAGRQLAAAVLGIDTHLPAAETRFRPPPLQFLQHVLHVPTPRIRCTAPKRSTPVCGAKGDPVATKGVRPLATTWPLLSAAPLRGVCPLLPPASGRHPAGAAKKAQTGENVVLALPAARVVNCVLVQWGRDSRGLHTRGGLRRGA